MAVIRARARHRKSSRGPSHSQLIRRSLAQIVSFVARVSGAVVAVMIVRLLGTGTAVGDYFIAYSAVNLLSNALVGVVELQSVRDLTGSDRLTSHTERTYVRGSLIMAALCTALLCATGLGLAAFGGRVAHIGELIVVLAPSLLFQAPCSVWLGLSLVRRWYLRGALPSLVRTVVVLGLCVLVAPTYGPIGVAVLVCCGEAIRLALFAAIFHRRTALDPDRGGVTARQVALSLARQMSSAAASGLNPVFDRWFLGLAGVGSVALLDLSDKASSLFATAYTQGVLPIVYARWSIHEAYIPRILRASFRVLLAASVWCAAAWLAIAFGASHVIGQHNVSQVGELRLIAAVYLAGVPAALATQTLLRALVLANHIAGLNRLTFLVVVTNAALDIPLGFAFGAPGVASSTTIASWLGLLATRAAIVRMAPTPPPSAEPRSASTAAPP